MINSKITRWLPIIFILALLVSLSAFLWVRNTANTFCRMPIDLYDDVSPREMSSPGKLEAGQKVGVAMERPPWVLVRAGSIEGYLPGWCLTKNPSDILPETNPYLMVVKEKTPVYLYPGQDTPISELSAGKVVKAESEYNNWLYVRIAVYDIPKVQRGWVSGEFLATREEAVPLEGKLPVGTKIFYGPNAEKHAGFPEEVGPNDQRVQIINETGAMVYAQGPGGWNAWVYKKDIVYDPF